MMGAQKKASAGVTALAAACLLLPSPRAQADPLNYDRSQFGQIVLTSPQSTASPEQILGENANYERIDRYDPDSRLRRLAGAVGRLDIMLVGQDDLANCTAFLISAEYVLTNYHCVPGTAGPIEAAKVLFGYLNDWDRDAPELFDVDLTPVEADARLDYAILRVLGDPGQRWPVTRLAAVDPRPGAVLEIVHHPLARPMRVTRGGCGADDPPLAYENIRHTCDTERGSSGSPLFDEDGRVVGLHRAGATDVNYATRMSALAEASPIIRAVIGGAPASPETGTGADPQAGSGTFRDRLADGRDCAHCPEMVTIPAGGFTMGSPPGEPDRAEDEGPQHQVAVDGFALGRFAVTQGAFAAFVAATGHDTTGGCAGWRGAALLLDPSRDWRNPGFAQADDHPVTCVSWDDARAYAAWLSAETGQPYRLPSEAEWEYAARAGTSAARYWGTAGACAHANVADQSAADENPRLTVAPCRDGYAYTAPVGRFAANGFGLADMLGNVWTWTRDCVNRSYAGAPADGSAWEGGDCSRRILRGGSWLDRPDVIRVAFRSWFTPETRINTIGFRVARDL